MKNLLKQSLVAAITLLIASPLAAAQTSLTDITKPLSATMSGKLNPNRVGLIAPRVAGTIATNKVAALTMPFTRVQAIVLRAKLARTAERNIMYRIACHDVKNAIVSYGLPEELQYKVFSYLKPTWQKIPIPEGWLNLKISVPPRPDNSAMQELMDTDVYSTATSPDSTRVITTAADGTVKIWNNTRQCLATLKAHIWPCVGQFNPDGTKIITTDNYGNIKVWNIRDINNIHCLISLQTIGTVLFVKINPEGTQIVTRALDSSGCWNVDKHVDKAWQASMSELEKVMRKGQQKSEKRNNKKKTNCAIQ